MGIHRELILALCRDENGNIPLVKVVGTSRIEVRFEESLYLPARDRPDFTAPLPPRGITPDIIGISVYLWKATRIWECDKCHQKTYEKGSVKPHCSNTQCRASGSLRLIGLKKSN